MIPIISLLETPRLFIRLAEENDPRAQACSCQATRGNLPYLPELEFSPVSSLLFYNASRPPSNYHLILKISDKTCEEKKVGVIGFFEWNPGERSGVLGFSLHRDYRNRGLMTEAAGAFISAWFREAGFTKITGKCQPANIASERVMVRSGMKKIKMVEEPLYRGSPVYKLNLFEITKADWKIHEKGKISHAIYR